MSTKNEEDKDDNLTIFNKDWLFLKKIGFKTNGITMRP